MKLVFSLLSLFPLLAAAQECKLISEKDPYTREIKISSGALSFQDAVLTIDADKKEIDFFFELSGKCFNDASTVVIYYEGTRTKTTFRNAGSMNCDGYFHFKFRNGTATPTALTRMQTLKVAQFIFKGSDDKEYTITLNPAQQQILQEVVGCVNTQSKALL